MFALVYIFKATPLAIVSFAAFFLVAVMVFFILLTIVRYQYANELRTLMNNEMSVELEDHPGVSIANSIYRLYPDLKQFCGKWNY